MKELFRCICKEPEGEVERVVYLAEFTQELLVKMWEKQKQFRTLMGREILSFPEFIDFFITIDSNTKELKPRGLCFIIDDCVGIFWMGDITWPAYAEVHYTFFDRRHKGREQLVGKAIQYIFDTWGINRLYVRVALYAKYPNIFVDLIGFKHEGRLRSCVQYRGQWWDTNCYSLLKNEVGPNFLEEIKERVNAFIQRQAERLEKKASRLNVIADNSVSDSVEVDSG